MYVRMYVFISLCLSVYLYFSDSLSVFVCLSVCLSVCMSDSQYTHIILFIEDVITFYKDQQVLIQLCLYVCLAVWQNTYISYSSIIAMPNSNNDHVSVQQS